MLKNTDSAESSVELSEQSIITNNRFIVFLDIMGFKDRVARNNHEKILKELEIFKDNISKCINYYPNAEIQPVLFSDSILIYSQNDDIESLHALADITSHIMMYAIQQETPIPLKGAIAAGCMTCNQTKQLYFGQALIDAYILEENVKYYGVLVHHSAEKYLQKSSFPEFRDIKVPLKSGDISHYELNWYNTVIKEGVANSKTVDDCLKKLRLTVSDEPRKYIDNTQRVMRVPEQKQYFNKMLKAIRYIPFHKFIFCHKNKEK